MSSNLPAPQQKQQLQQRFVDDGERYVHRTATTTTSAAATAAGSARREEVDDDDEDDEVEGEGSESDSDEGEPTAFGDDSEVSCRNQGYFFSKLQHVKIKAIFLYFPFSF